MHDGICYELLYKFKYEMAVAEKSVKEEGTISADDLEAELGV